MSVVVTDKDEHCLNCKFYDASNQGFCRRNAPIPVLLYSKDRGKPIIKGMFPTIEKPEKDWCGQFESNQE